MANGRSPGRRSGTGGFSGSGRSRGGRAGRGGSGKSGGGSSSGISESYNSGGVEVSDSPLSSARETLAGSRGGGDGWRGNKKTTPPAAQVQATPLVPYVPITVTPTQESDIPTVDLPVIEVVEYLTDEEREETPYNYRSSGGSYNEDRGNDRVNTANSNPNVQAFPDNPALLMVYNPKTNEYSIVDAATGETIGGLELQDDGSFKETGILEQLEKGNPGDPFSIGETFNSYSIEDGKLNYAKLEKSMITEKNKEPGYQYTTTYTEATWSGIDKTISNYNPGVGEVNRIDKTYSTFIGNISIDEHTINTRITDKPRTLGFVAETATDIAEAFNAAPTTVHEVARAADIVATVAGIALSLVSLGMGLPGAFKSIQGFASALSDLNNAINGISALNDTYGLGYSLSGAISRRANIHSLYGSNLHEHYSNGDGDSKRIAREGLAGAFMESPAYIEYNFLNSAHLMPVQNYDVLNKYEIKSPKIDEREDNMQQSIMPTSLIGMNNVKEGHLLSADEAMYLRNIDTLSGVIKSTNKHNLVLNLADNYDASYEFDDDGNRGRLTYYIRDNASFASVANQTFALVSGRLYKVNTKKPGTLPLVRSLDTMTINSGRLTIRIENKIADSLMQQCLDLVKKIKVVAPVERLNQKDPKDGSLPAYSAVAAAITTTDLENKIKSQLELGKRFFHIEGTTGANNGDRIAVALGGTTEYTIATDKTWRMDLDLLDAFGSILNVNNNGTDEIYYAVTAYDKTSGMESLPIKSNSCFNFSKLIALYIENPSNEYSLKIYRKDVASSMYKFVSLQSYKENSVFIDNLADIPSPQFLDFTEIKEVTGLKGLVEHKATLFAYKGSYVYFSKPGRPNIWNELQCVTVNEQITGLASSPLGLMIFTKNSTYLLGGTDRVNYTISNISKSIGCSVPSSVGNIKNAVLWVFDGDVMLSIGSTINNLTKGRYRFNHNNVINSVVVGDVYYIFCTDKTIKFDFSLNHPMITEMDITNAFGCVVNNELYFVKDNNLYKAYDIAELSNSLIETVKFTAQSMDITKEFNSVNIVYKGSFKISVLIDDVIVVTQDFSSTKTAVADIGIPVDFNEGMSIHLRFEGSGEIYSYRYIFDNRNLR